ncbi:uncharacterized protein [Magallana gigas]|uniref:uncharacterized protein isoform X1 n=1 Tax=Magallana gigas TaxID=29159 RepID=UPI00334029ED
MDSFDKVNDGVNSNKCATDDNVRMNLMNQRSKTIDEWILKRKEAWKFQEELLRSLTNKPTKDSHVFDDLFILSKKARKMKELHQELLGMVGRKQEKEERKTVGCLSPGEFFC